MALVPVELGGRSYEVRIARGLLHDAAQHCAPLLRKDTVQIVTDENVAAAWREPVAASFAAQGIAAHWLVLPPGEGSKSWGTLARVTDWLLAEQVERGDRVLALGGGVIGDLVGFAAAILKRGCKFIQLPTTLLAQVDSSVGGKTAINTTAGKNLVGAFHQPSLVLADLDALATLPEREMRAGYAEVLKYGVLGDAEFFDWLADNGPAVLAREDAPLEHAVAASVAAKARIVAEDERETGDRRALLNLGHTFGHALEAETGFSDRLLHGEGVALGMVLAARYSARARADRRWRDRTRHPRGRCGRAAERDRRARPRLRWSAAGRTHVARQENGRRHAAVRPAARHRRGLHGARRGVGRRRRFPRRGTASALGSKLNQVAVVTERILVPGKEQGGSDAQPS